MFYEIQTEFGAWRLLELPLTVAAPVAPTDSVTRNPAPCADARRPRRLFRGRHAFT
jgi:hypothetical protein